MKIKNNKLILMILASFAAIILLNACATDRKEDVKKDCSTVFESRYVNKKGEPVKGRGKFISQNATEESDDQAENMPTECKVLEVKLDNNIRCELVGSDKITALSEAITTKNKDRTIVIIPEAQIRDLGKMALKYLKTNGLDIEKHFDSELFASLDFPYKGMKCISGNQKFVVWTGDKKVILIVEKK